MATVKNTLRLVQGIRQISTTNVTKAAGGEIHPGYFKFKEVQKQFQKPDGLPVHLKGGAVDKILYGATVIGCFVGFGYMFEMLYRLSYPKKN